MAKDPKKPKKPKSARQVARQAGSTTRKPSTRDMVSADDAEKEKRQQEAAKLNDFLTDWGGFRDEFGSMLHVTDEEHPLERMRLEDPELYADTISRYDLSTEHTSALGLGVGEEAAGGLTDLAGLQDMSESGDWSYEDQDFTGGDPGILSPYITELSGGSGSRSALGAPTTAATPRGAKRMTEAERAAVSSTDTRRGPRRTVYRRPGEATAAAMVKTQSGKKVDPLAVIEQRTRNENVISGRDLWLPDVPGIKGQQDASVDVGLAPLTRARKGVAEENKTRLMVGGMITRMALENQANPGLKVTDDAAPKTPDSVAEAAADVGAQKETAKIVTSANARGKAPDQPAAPQPSRKTTTVQKRRAFDAPDTASPEATTEQYGTNVDPGKLHPNTIAFARRFGLTGLFGGTLAGGTSVKGSDSVVRRVGAYRVGRPQGDQSMVRSSRGTAFDVATGDDLGKITEVGPGGKRTERPDISVRAVEGTTGPGRDPREAELELANPLDTTAPDPNDPNYTPVDYAGRTLNPAQQALAREYQADLLARGRQPFATGIIPKKGIIGKDDATFTQPIQRLGFGKGIEKVAREGEMSNEEALDAIRENIGRFEETEREMSTPVGGRIYADRDIMREPKRPATSVSQRVIQVPRSSGAMRTNPQTGLRERATTGYQVFAPSETQLGVGEVNEAGEVTGSGLIDQIQKGRIARGKAPLELGSPEYLDLVARIDTGVSPGVMRTVPLDSPELEPKQTPRTVEPAAPSKVEQVVPGQNPIVVKSSGQFSSQFEAQLAARDRARTAEDQKVTDAYKAMREGPNAEDQYDTPGYIKSWDALESMQSGRKIDGLDFASRLLGTDLEQFNVDQMGIPAKSTSDYEKNYGRVLRPGRSYDVPNFYKSKVDSKLPDTSPGGTPLYDPKMATPFVVFSTSAPPTDVARPSVLNQTQLAANRERADQALANRTPQQVEISEGRLRKMNQRADAVPSVMDKEAFATFQANRPAPKAPKAPKQPKNPGKKQPKNPGKK